jgi:hypothetical protein
MYLNVMKQRQAAGKLKDFLSPYHVPSKPLETLKQKNHHLVPFERDS